MAWIARKTIRNCARPFGGGGALKKDLVEKGGNMPMVGGDGIADDPAWLTTAGAAATNTYGTVAAPDISGLTSAAASKFISDYKAAFPGKDLLPYSAMAYDAERRQHLLVSFATSEYASRNGSDSLTNPIASAAEHPPNAALNWFSNAREAVSISWSNSASRYWEYL